MKSDNELRLEMLWTPYELPRCNRLWGMEGPVPRYCRRQAGHDGDHASGVTVRGFLRWN